ncbi:MAG: AraC family transcriptional regulator [Parasporobacterium sp.]|nr:AraC family transcriptional regulator [Parasporobacterium sp.]
MKKENLFKNYMYLISEKDAENVYRLKGETGEGIMRRYNVAPGVEFVYSEIESFYPIYAEQKKFINYLEIMYMLEGHADFVMENRLCASADKGDVLIFNSKIAAKECIVRNGMRCVSFVVFIDDLADELNRFFGTKDFNKDEIFKDALKAKSCIRFPANETLENIFKELLRIPEKYENHYRKLLSFQAIVALLDVKDSGIGNYSYFSGDAGNKVHKVRKILGESLSSKITIEELAERVNLNRTSLQRIFKQMYGVTINEYRTRERIQEAKNLLLNKELSVIDVAGMCGYANASKFSAVFKKNTGMSPMEWRNK